jgi:hypothetical protein
VYLRMLSLNRLTEWLTEMDVLRRAQALTVSWQGASLHQIKRKPHT